MRILRLVLLAALAVLVIRVVMLSGRVAEAAPSDTPRGAGLSQERLDILLAVEDPSFYDHIGVDVRTPGAGWTTITQGLVKIHGYGSFEPGLGHWRKVEQSAVAILVDARVGKDDQLALFLDTAYFGEWEHGPVQGFDAAARAYYDKELNELTEAEFVGLVAMLAGPNAYHPLSQPEAHAERVRRIERLLAGACSPAGWRDILYRGCADETAVAAGAR